VKRALGLLLLFLLAAAYMRLALFIPINWTDEGVIIYPIWRVAEGELPYRDFQQMYGPSLFLLGGFLFRLFGSDLAVIRYFLLAVKAATSVMVYLAARRVSGPPFAFIAYAFSVVLAGLIWNVSSIPYASFFGTALCLTGLLCFLACERRFLLGCAAAGLCFGFAATFKQTAGAFAFLGLALYLLTERGSWEGRPGAILTIVIRASRWFVLLFTLALALFYLTPNNPFWNFALLLTPTLALTGHLARCELRGELDLASRLRSFWGTVTLSLAFLLPFLGYGLYFVYLGLGREILFNTVFGIPSAVDWISPFPSPSIDFGLWQLACFGGFAALAIWGGRSRDVMQGRRRWSFVGLLALSLLAAGSLALSGWQARGDDWWFWGSSDLLFGVPFVLVWLSIAERVRLGRSGESNRRLRAFSLFACYGPMALLSLYPAADIWHILALLPACLPLLAYGLERFWQAPGAQGRAAGGWRLGAGAAIAGFALVLLFPAVHDVVRARGIAPAFKQSLPRATGIRGGSGLYMSTRSGGKLVRFLMQEPQRDEALFILSAKSLFYFLADRVSPVQEYEYILYLVAADLIREEPARKLVDQDELIRRLKQARPLIVDDHFDDQSENVRRMYPRFANFIDTHYREAETFGSFRVLRWNVEQR
jgi:hypothetical protein